MLSVPLPFHASSYRRRSHAVLRRRLLRELQGLPYLGLQRCVMDLLTATGYIQVRALGRRHVRGRNAAGGADITAFTSPVVTKLRVIGQIKCYGPGRSVQRRSVIELRGTMTQLDAKQGLMFTTARFSSPAIAASVEKAREAPVFMADGDTVVRHLIRCGIGVYRAPGDGRYRLKADYFRTLRNIQPQRPSTGKSARLSDV